MVKNVLYAERVQYALTTDDSYIAAGFHAFVESQDRQMLECVLLATGRRKRLWSGLEYTPQSVLHSLANDNDPRIKLRVARHSNANTDTLSILADTTSDLNILVRIAIHMNTSVETLLALYRNYSDSTELRLSLSHNVNTPGSLLTKLVDKSSVEELKGIVRNDSADAAILKHCWEQNDLYLQAEVVAHRNCPDNLLSAAVNSTHTLVRQKLAGNPKLAEEYLIRLLGDDESLVRAAAVKNFNIRPSADLTLVEDDPSQFVRRNQARHTGLPQHWIKRLSNDKDSWVRRLIARNPSVPPKTLWQLAGDSVMEVRRAVARNRHCPADLLTKLAHDQHSWVRAGVALKCEISEPLIFTLSKDTDVDIQSSLGRNPSTPQSILKRIARHSNRDVRRAVVLNKNSTNTVLRVLSDDPYPLNRVFLVGHRNIDTADLEAFLMDPEPMVRFAGARSLASREF